MAAGRRQLFEPTTSDWSVLATQADGPRELAEMSTSTLSAMSLRR
jgi:hypothetical protein